LSSKVAEQIRLLKELQEIDRKIRDIEKAKSDLPKRRQDLANARARERADLEGSKGLVKKNDEERRRLEKEIEFDKEALSRFEARTQDVSSPDAFNAANRELETRRKTIKEKEESILRLAEEKQVLEKKAAAVEAEFVNVDKRYAEQEKELEAQNASVDAQTAGLRGQRTELAKGVTDKSLLSRYEQIFKRREGVAIVAVRAEVCQGCDMGVPPQIVNFARSGEQGIQTCPHCNRIIVWEPSDRPAEGAAKTKRSRKKKDDVEDDDKDDQTSPEAELK